jgi:hypothetical protein
MEKTSTSLYRKYQRYIENENKPHGQKEQAWYDCLFDNTKDLSSLFNDIMNLSDSMLTQKTSKTHEKEKELLADLVILYVKTTCCNSAENCQTPISTLLKRQPIWYLKQVESLEPGLRSNCEMIIFSLVTNFKEGLTKSQEKFLGIIKSHFRLDINLSGEQQLNSPEPTTGGKEGAQYVAAELKRYKDRERKNSEQTRW